MRSITSAILGAAVVAGLGILPGCSTLKYNLNGLSDYQEYEHDGRIYVLGRADTIRNFELTHEVTISMTKLGAGPKGETVVLESDAKDPFLAATLWKFYRQYHGL